MYEKQNDSLDVVTVISVLHSYLASINLEAKLKIDVIGIKVVKNFIKLLMQIQDLSGEEI